MPAPRDRTHPRKRRSSTGVAHGSRGAQGLAGPRSPRGGGKRPAPRRTGVFAGSQPGHAGFGQSPTRRVRPQQVRPRHAPAPRPRPQRRPPVTPQGRRRTVFGQSIGEQGRRQTRNPGGARTAANRRRDRLQKRYRPTFREPVVPVVARQNVTPRHYHRIQRATVAAYARAGRRQGVPVSARERAALRSVGNKRLTNNFYARKYLEHLQRNYAPWRYTLPQQMVQAERAMGAVQSYPYAGTRHHRSGLMGVGVKIGGGSTGLLASATLGRLNRNLAQVGVGKVARAPLTWGKAVVSDAISLPAETVPSTYGLLAAGFEAARGDTARAHALWRDYKQSDALALAAQGKFKKAGQAFVQHPVSTALEATGYARGLSRGVGAIGRARQHFGGKPASWADQRRPDLTLEGTSYRQRRRYSPDPVARQFEIRRDRRAKAKAQRDQQEADRYFAEGNEVMGRHKMRQATQRLHVNDDELKRGLDERGGVNEELRRDDRRAAIIAARPAVLSKRHGGHIVRLVAERIINARPGRTLRQDAEAYLGELVERGRDLPKRGAAYRANRATVRRLTEALNSKRVDWNRVETAAESFVGESQAARRALIDAKMLDPEAAERAPLIPYAVRNMGARHVEGAEYEAIRDASRAEQVRVLEADTERLRAHLSRATDPGERQAALREINRREREVFRLLPAEERKARVGGAKSLEGAARQWLKRAEAELASARQREAVLRGRTGERVRRSDLAARRRNPEYVAVAQSYASAVREVAAARKAMRNAARLPGRYSPEEEAAIRARLQNANKRLAMSKDVLKNIRNEMDERPRSGAQPHGDLARLEQARATVLLFERRVAKARGDLKEASGIRRRTEQHARARPVKDKFTAGLALDGRSLPTSEIKAHMRDAIGTDEAAFVTQAPNMRGAKNFFQMWFPRVSGVAGRSRTGKATLEGTFDTDPQVLVEELVRAVGMVDADNGFKAAIGEFGLRYNDVEKMQARLADPDIDPAEAHSIQRALQRGAKPGELWTEKDYADAESTAAALERLTGRKWRPVKLTPWSGNREMLQALLEDINDPGDIHMAETGGHAPIREAIEDAIAKGNSGPGEYAIWPDAVANRLHEHMRVFAPGTVTKVFQKINVAFARTVLSLSTKWLTGNVVEAALRTSLLRAGPRSLYVGRQGLAQVRALAESMDDADTMKRVAPEYIERVTRGGQGSHYERLMMRRGAEQFAHSHRYVQQVARAMATLTHAPGPRHIGDAWAALTHLTREVVSGGIERQFQHAMAGRYMRDWLMDDHAVKTSQKAIEQAARGLLDTNEQRAMGRYVDRAYGQYSKFSPGYRSFIVTYTPFAAWWVNAYRFVYSVLPKDHPVATALLATANIATEEWRKKYGLDLSAALNTEQFGGSGGEGTVAPAFLQGSIPVAGGKGKVRLARFTPFGAFGDAPGAVAQQLLPQYSGALKALTGQDWKGDPLKVDGHEPSPEQKFAIAFQVFMESTVPVSPQFSRLVLEGDGSWSSRLRREFDPFKATYPKGVEQAQGGKGGAGLPVGGGWHVAGGGSVPETTTGGGWKVVP